MRALLEERLEWPVGQWRAGGPWRLGHGLTVVGPGWWRLVRRGFALVAETPGASVTDVRQKCAVFEMRFHHADRTTLERLRALGGALTRASRAWCEGCGVGVPPVDAGLAPWRNHCARCRARLQELQELAGSHAERWLWEERAGVSWPPSEW
jgi:hypothetical protein